MKKKFVKDLLQIGCGVDVVLSGWVCAKRKQGKIIFWDVCDSTGKIQVVITEDLLSAEKFTERTRKEKKYFQDLGRVMEKTNIVIDLPLPTYINQTSLTIKDVVPVMDEKKKIEMVTLDKNFCNEKVKKSLVIKEVSEFYEEQVRDEYVGKVLSKSRWERCKN